MKGKIVDTPQNNWGGLNSFFESLVALPPGKALFFPSDSEESRIVHSNVQAKGFLKGFKFHRRKSAEGTYFWMTPKEPK